MLIWLTLFLIILVVSFLLAMRSMLDYQEQPQSFGLPYSLYLIKNPKALTDEVIQKIYDTSRTNKLVVSLERLSKGGKKALVIFAPVALLKPLMKELDLLELEDYSTKELSQSTLSWEMGLKSGVTLPKDAFLSLESCKLQDGEEIWWQMVLQPSQDSLFKTEIRVVVWAQTIIRTKEIQQELLNLAALVNLTLLPQAYSAHQMVKFYQKRSLPHSHLLELKGKENPLLLLGDQIRQLLGLPKA